MGLIRGLWSGIRCLPITADTTRINTAAGELSFIRCAFWQLFKCSPRDRQSCHGAYLQSS